LNRNYNRTQGKGLASIEAVENWFYGNSRENVMAYWALYSGTKPINQASIQRNTTVSDLDESWVWLKGLLDDYSFNGGTFLITVSKVTSNAGTSLPRTVVTLSPAAHQNNIHGIHGNNFPTGIRGTGKSEADIRAEERHLVNMERNMDDLKAEIASIRHENRSTAETISGFVQSEGGMNFINQIAGFFQPRGTNIGIAGFNPSNINPPAIEDEAEQEADYNYGDDVIEVIDRIRHTIGDAAFPALIEKMNAMSDMEIQLFINFINQRK